MRQSMLSERRLTIGYLAALGLVALLTVASHLTLNRVLAEHEGSAEIVNISGRQRMLSQRIASLAAQYKMGSPTAKADLLATVKRFEAAHRTLLADSIAVTRPGRSAAAFRDIYFAGEVPLDGEVATYISLARQVAAQKPEAADTGQVLDQLFREARSPLLQRLDNVVALHQQDSEQQLNRLEMLQEITLAVVLITLAIEALTIFRPMVRRVARYASELLHMATIDGLTGALNRTSFLDQAAAALVQGQRRAQPAAVLMIDADHFKAINDTHGHDGGDAALRMLGQAIGDACRVGDVAGRLGGEEFALVLPATPELAAIAFAQRLRARVERLDIQHCSKPIALTVSIGIATVAPADPADLAALLRTADRALYEAKAAGRNRVAGGALVPSAPVLAWAK